MPEPAPLTPLVNAQPAPDGLMLCDVAVYAGVSKLPLLTRLTGAAGCAGGVAGRFSDLMPAYQVWAIRS